MDLRLPERTAREMEWHDGARLWVKTLNLWERDEAAEAAEIWAHSAARFYRQGGEGFAVLLERFRYLSVEDRAAYLAESGLRDGSFAAAALERFPDPERPSDAAHLDVWEIARATAVARREELLRDKYDTARAHAMGLGEAASVERCALEFGVRRLAQLRGFRLVCETLQRAVRLHDDHSRRLFADVGAVMELSDGERDYLWSGYSGMQLDPDQVPTSAAVSRA